MSSATGHQQSNRGGGGAGQATYWETRRAKMADQARAKVGFCLRSFTFYLLHTSECHETGDARSLQSSELINCGNV